MKDYEFYITTGLGAIALILTLTLVGLSFSNESWSKDIGTEQRKLQQQMQEIQLAAKLQQFGKQIVRDTVILAEKNNNQKLRDLLTKNNINYELKKDTPSN